MTQSTTLDTEGPCPGEIEESTPRTERRLVAVPVPFDSIAPATWDAIAARTPWGTPFSSWCVHRAWWDGYAEGAHDQTLLVVDPAAPDPTVPVAIVPLMHRHEVEPGDAAVHVGMRHPDAPPLSPVPPTAKAVFFGASYHGDYATLLACPEDVRAVADAVVRELVAPPEAGDRHPDPWDVVDLRRVRRGDPSVDALEGAFKRLEPAQGWSVTREQEDVCPVLTLPEGIDFDGYLGTLPKKQRHEVRRKIRRAESAGDIRFVESPEPLADLDVFIDLHQKRWGAEGLFPPTAGGAASRRFFASLFERCGGPDGPLKLNFLWVGETRIAGGVHFDDGESLYYFNAGTDPAARDLSPGVIMVAEYIKLAISQGRRRLDFLRGNEAYKYEWGAVDEPIERLLVRRMSGDGRTRA